MVVEHYKAVERIKHVLLYIMNYIEVQSRSQFKVVID